MVGGRVGRWEGQGHNCLYDWPMLSREWRHVLHVPHALVHYPNNDHRELALAKREGGKEGEESARTTCPCGAFSRCSSSTWGSKG
jgi:hypothetical protein